MTAVRVALLAAWAALSTLLLVRAVELLSFVHFVVADAGWLAHTLSLSALGALVLGIPLIAARRGVGAVGVAALSAGLLVVGLCDGPLLYRPPGTLLTRQTLLITGGNSGIGLAVGRAAAERGARVLLGCRSASACEAAAADVRRSALASGGTAEPVLAPLDLTDLRLVRSFAAQVTKQTQRLDTLVLNAGFAPGIGDGRPAVTAQGIELALGAMHVGHALLADLLLPMMEGGHPDLEPARLVTVSSEGAHLAPRLHASLYRGSGEGDLRGEITTVESPIESPSLLANLCFDKVPRALSPLGFSSFSVTYLRAKYANALYARAMSERPRRRGARRVISSAVGPGFVATSIFSASGLHSLGYMVIHALTAVYMRSPRLGALPVLRAVFDSPDAIDGVFIDSMGFTRSFDQACWAAHGCSAEEARQLMQVTRRLVRSRGEIPNQTVGVHATRDAAGASGGHAETLYVWAFGVGAALLAISLAVPVTKTRMSNGPTVVEHCVNRLLHTRLGSAFAGPIFWSLMSLVAALLLAPCTILLGALRAMRELAIVFGAVRSEVPRAQRSQLAVLVTGCDSGFGRAVAIELCERGYTVFAGCLAVSSRAQLHTQVKSMPANTRGVIQPLRLDVTSHVEVDGAVDQVRAWLTGSDSRRLLAVVNNAGVGSGGLIDWLSIADFERDMAVNYFGSIRVTKACLPLLKDAAGVTASNPRGQTPRPRVVMIASMAGKVPGVPLQSPYSASKHAVACFASCLRMEVSTMWGIDVTTVCPSFHKTPILDASSIERAWTSLPIEAQREYGPGYEKTTRATANWIMQTLAWEAQMVINEIVNAVTLVQSPPAEVIIGSDARYFMMPLLHLPLWFVEMVVRATSVDLLPKPARTAQG